MLMTIGKDSVPLSKNRSSCRRYYIPRSIRFTYTEYMNFNSFYRTLKIRKLIFRTGVYSVMFARKASISASLMSALCR